MNAPRFGAALAFILLALAAVLFLYHRDDKPQLAIQSACATKPLPNPCATMKCEAKTDTRQMT